jgi:hypothetical protein
MLRRMSDQIELLAAEERVGLIDGAPWIRNQFELSGFVKDLGLDFYHLQDNVQKARRSVFGEDSSEGQTWLQELLHTFKHEGYNTAWDGLTACVGDCAARQLPVAPRRRGRAVLDGLLVVCRHQQSYWYMTPKYGKKQGYFSLSPPELVFSGKTNLLETVDPIKPKTRLVARFPSATEVQLQVFVRPSNRSYSRRGGVT